MRGGEEDLGWGVKGEEQGRDGGGNPRALRGTRGDWGVLGVWKTRVGDKQQWLRRQQLSLQEKVWTERKRSGGRS